MKPGLKDKNPKNPKYHFCFLIQKIDSAMNPIPNKQEFTLCL